MADYTPLIQHAVDGLENNTGENLRVLYERARVALTAQLRGMEPPLEESDILALIVFNRPVNELGTGERSSLAATAGGIATPAVPKPLTNPVAAPGVGLGEIGQHGFDATCGKRNRGGEPGRAAANDDGVEFPFVGRQSACRVHGISD